MTIRSEEPTNIKEAIRNFVEKTSSGRLEQSFTGKWHCVDPENSRMDTALCRVHIQEDLEKIPHRRCSATECPYELPSSPRTQESAREEIRNLIREHCDAEFISKLSEDKRFLVIKGIMNEIKLK